MSGAAFSEAFSCGEEGHAQAGDNGQRHRAQHADPDHLPYEATGCMNVMLSPQCACQRVGGACAQHQAHGEADERRHERLKHELPCETSLAESDEHAHADLVRAGECGEQHQAEQCKRAADPQHDHDDASGSGKRAQRFDRLHVVGDRGRAHREALRQVGFERRGEFVDVAAVLEREHDVEVRD